MRSKQLEQKKIIAMILNFFTTFHLKFFITSVIAMESIEHGERGCCNGEMAACGVPGLVCQKNTSWPVTPSECNFCIKRKVTGNTYKVAAFNKNSFNCFLNIMGSFLLRLFLFCKLNVFQAIVSRQ